MSSYFTDGCICLRWFSCHLFVRFFNILLICLFIICTFFIIRMFFNLLLLFWKMREGFNRVSRHFKVKLTRWQSSLSVSLRSGEPDCWHFDEQLWSVQAWESLLYVRLRRDAIHPAPSRLSYFRIIGNLILHACRACERSTCRLSSAWICYFLSQILYRRSIPSITPHQRSH